MQKAQLGFQLNTNTSIATWDQNVISFEGIWRRIGNFKVVPSYGAGVFKGSLKLDMKVCTKFNGN